jgi:hypothetical protein
VIIVSAFAQSLRIRSPDGAVPPISAVVLCVQLLEEPTDCGPDPNAVDVAHLKTVRGGPEPFVVDVVHGHSTLVLQGVEVYQGRPITYGAVGCVDRERVRNKRSALFELVVRDGDPDEEGI